MSNKTQTAVFAYGINQLLRLIGYVNQLALCVQNQVMVAGAVAARPQFLSHQHKHRALPAFVFRQVDILVSDDDKIQPRTCSSPGYASVVS